MTDQVWYGFQYFAVCAIAYVVYMHIARGRNFFSSGLVFGALSVLASSRYLPIQQLAGLLSYVVFIASWFFFLMCITVFSNSISLLMLTRLDLRRGRRLSTSEIRMAFPAGTSFEHRVNSLVEQGLACRSGDGGLRVTGKGRILLKAFDVLKKVMGVEEVG